MPTPKPTPEQTEAAKKLSEEIAMNGLTPSLWIAVFLARRDAEIIRPWREAVEIFTHGHTVDCQCVACALLSSPSHPSPAVEMRWCGKCAKIKPPGEVYFTTFKKCIACGEFTSDAPPSPAPNKGESHG